MARVLKSIAIGSFIIFLACCCFLLAIKASDIAYVKQITLFYTHSPIENVFLVLITIVIGVFMVITDVSGKKYKITISGLVIFILSIIIFGLFGMPGLVALVIGSKIVLLVLAHYANKSI